MYVRIEFMTSSQICEMYRWMDVSVDNQVYKDAKLVDRIHVKAGKKCTIGISPACNMTVSHPSISRYRSSPWKICNTCSCCILWRESQELVLHLQPMAIKCSSTQYSLRSCCLFDVSIHRHLMKLFEIPGLWILCSWLDQIFCDMYFCAMWHNWNCIPLIQFMIGHNDYDAFW